MTVRVGEKVFNIHVEWDDGKTYACGSVVRRTLIYVHNSVFIPILLQSYKIYIYIENKF